MRLPHSAGRARFNRRLRRANVPGRPSRRLWFRRRAIRAFARALIVGAVVLIALALKP